MILNNAFDDLSSLNPGESAEITGFGDADGKDSFMYRLYEVGFLVGEKLQVLNRAPISGCPISIKIKDATYAIRSEDAKLIHIKKLEKKS